MENKDLQNKDSVGSDGKMIDPQVAPKDESKVSDLKAEVDLTKFVGIDKFLEMKKQLKELKKTIEGGASQNRINQEIEDLGKEHNVDPEFLKKLTSTIEKNVSDKFGKPAADDKDDEVVEDKKTIAPASVTFDQHFDTIIDRMPDFKDIANKAVVRSLAKDPANGNKTISQIIEETYGHLLTGKRTIESTKPAGGKDPGPLNYEKAMKDPKYFEEIMADPSLKREYNAEMLKRGI